MVSIKTIYSRAFAVLRKKPFLLWGISLLAMLLSALSVPLLGVIPAASIAVSMLLQTAMTLIYLRGYRGEEIAVTQLFDTFKDWKTVKRVLCGALQPSTTWHFHAANGHRANIVHRDDGRQLLGVVNRIEFGAADYRDPTAHVAIVERCVGKRRAISGDKQVSSLVVRRLQGHELYLARPLGELALRLGFGGCGINHFF